MAATSPPESTIQVRVDQVLSELVSVLREALGSALYSVILFGSAAEGAIRPSSDVNVIIVLDAFEPDQLDGLRAPLRTLQAAVRLSPMFLLRSEIDPASEAFPEKFADIARRRRVLYGEDPFGALLIPRAVQILRLKQVLLNVVLRLRQRYMLQGLREEQAAIAIAESAGTLRPAAASLLELENRPAATPKLALEQLARELGTNDFAHALANLSMARETLHVPSGEAAITLLSLLKLAMQMREKAEALA